MTGNIKLKDIAQALGISVTTVSRGLNGYHDVAENTRQRIVEYTQRVGYSFNMSAYSLKVGKSNVIGLIYPFTYDVLSNHQERQFIHTIERKAAERGYNLMLLTDVFHDLNATISSLYNAKRCDALIFAHIAMTQDKIAFINQQGIPALFYGLRPENTYWVDVDYTRAADSIVDYLQRWHLTKVLYLNSSNGTPSEAHKKAAFDAACQHHGLTKTMTLSCKNDRQSAWRAVGALLGRENDVTAIVTSTNTQAEGVSFYLRQYDDAAPLLASFGEIDCDGLPGRCDIAINPPDIGEIVERILALVPRLNGAVEKAGELLHAEVVFAQPG